MSGQGVAGFRAWIACGVATACVACGASQSGPAIGASTGPTASGPSASVDGGVASTGPLPNPLPSDFRSSMTRVSAGHFLSKGHAGGRWDAEVYADPAVADALRNDAAARAAIPVGARFVEEHFERSDGGAGPVMVMEKRPPGFDPARGDWRYTAIAAHGAVVKDGLIDGCAGCHGQAAGDHVFRVKSEP
jgi:hypothetical protein